MPITSSATTSSFTTVYGSVFSPSQATNARAQVLITDFSKYDDAIDELLESGKSQVFVNDRISRRIEEEGFSFNLRSLMRHVDNRSRAIIRPPR